MKIQILGSGCGKCRRLFANVESAVKRNGIDCEIVKIEEIEKIAEMGAMMTPALALDGKVVCSGRVPGVEEIEKILMHPSLPA